MEFSPHLVETAQWIHRLSSHKKEEMLQIARKSPNVPRPNREVLEMLSDTSIRNKILKISTNDDDDHHAG